MSDNLGPKDVQLIRKTVRVKTIALRYKCKMKNKKDAAETVDQMKNYVEHTRIPATEEGVINLFRHFGMRI